MRTLAAVLMATALSAPCFAQRTVTRPGTSPVVNVKIVFTAGAAVDPPGKAGLARMTALMISGGGTKDLTYRQVVDAFYPMAAGLGSSVDQELTTFSGATHIDNLDAYYKLVKSMLLAPGWREEDFRRLKDQALNNVKVGLRANNDEELGKEVLLAKLYAGTPYANPASGTVSGLESITLDDIKAFYKQHYTRSNLILGVAGGYPASFLATMQKDFAALPEKDDTKIVAITPAKIEHTHATIVEKNTRSIAFSLGFPIDVKRGDPDYPALLLMQAYFGPHRQSSGVLFQRIREIRGINYGDYAYIEYFPNGSARMQPPTGIPRRSQAFQIWIRPVEPPTAVFTLRLAMFELDRLVREGISEEHFESTRQYLSKYVNVLTSSKEAELGYAIDSLFYGTPDYVDYVKQSIAKLTREQVNAAIRKHLRTDRMEIAIVSGDAAALKTALTGEVATISYNSPPPAAVLEEDKTVGRFDIGLRPEDIDIIPLEQTFQ